MSLMKDESKATALLEPSDGISERGRICFVCTGNTCRSPMAEALFNHLGRDGGYIAVSAGLYASGEEISENAIRALEGRGVDVIPYIGRRSLGVSAELLKDCDLVIGISRSHADSLIFAFPEYASRITALPFDIPDPWGGGLDDYRRTLGMLETALVEMGLLG